MYFSYLMRNIAIWGKYYSVANGLKIHFKFSNYIFHLFHECKMTLQRAKAVAGMRRVRRGFTSAFGI